MACGYGHYMGIMSFGIMDMSLFSVAFWVDCFAISRWIGTWAMDDMTKNALMTGMAPTKWHHGSG